MVFATMVMTATVFVVWNGIQQDGPWLDRLLAGLEHMSWAIITSTGLTTTLILVWERLAMVLAHRWLDRKREEVLQEGRQEGRHEGRQEGRQEGRREAALQLQAWMQAQGGLEEAANAIQGWLGRQKEAMDAGREFNEPMPFGNAKPHGWPPATLCFIRSMIYLPPLANMVSQKPKLQHTWRYQCPM